jgi:hypothetical protein
MLVVRGRAIRKMRSNPLGHRYNAARKSGNFVCESHNRPRPMIGIAVRGWLDDRVPSGSASQTILPIPRKPTFLGECDLLQIKIANSMMCIRLRASHAALVYICLLFWPSSLR